MNIFERLSFRKQLLLFFTVGILVMLGITSYIQYLTAEKTIRAKHVEQGLKLSTTFASQSVLALIFDSEINAQDAVASILEFPDVVSAEIFRLDNSPLLFSGDVRFKIDRQISHIKDSMMEFENEASWYFIAPVVQPSEEESPFEEIDQTDEVIGYIRLAVSKKSLNANAQQHLISNLMTSAALGVVFVLLLMWLAQRITSPIRNLVKSMKQVEAGHREVRAQVAGPSDIKRIVQAFNQMIESREAEEEQIKKAHDMAVEVAQMKGDFAANVSHELRTPMNGIMGMVDILRNSGNLNSKQAEYLEVIHTSSESLLDLINDILDFTKIDSGKIDLVNEDFYLEDCAQTVIDLLSGQAQRKDIEIGLIMDHDLPDLVNGDSNRIRQVLINLVGNAIKFTDEGEVVIRLELLTETDDQITYKFSVEDTGIGIDSDSLEKIYQPFQQIDSSSNSKYAGTGLGLTISQQLIDILGGEMGVESEPGKGSAFWFTVPFNYAKNEPKYNVEKHRPEVAGLRVMVIDDSVVNRHAISSILTNWEAYQQTAPTGMAALNKLKQAANKGKSFDFVIMDHQMKSMNYEDLISHIKSNAELRTTRIIMTINSNSLGKTEALRRGVDGIIQKPVRDIKLYQCMTSIMNAQSAPEYNQISQQQLVNFNRRVLICEDTETNVIVAEEILLKLGCTVDVAINGQDAIDNYRPSNYDLVLMDCRMPIMDGYQATKIYRSRELQGTHTPIIAMTANTQKDDKQNCIDAGMDDYLPKPLSIESVKEILVKWANNPDGIDQDVLPETEDFMQEKQVASAVKPVSSSTDVLLTAGIDNKQFQHLLNTVGSKTIVRMLQVFLDDMPGLLHDLSTAALQHDRKTIIDSAHTLKSSSQNFGSISFANLAKNIELNAPSENMESLSRKIKDLSEEGTALQRELEFIRDQQNSKIDIEIEYNILVVEDNKSEAMAISTSLQNNNLSVELAKNGSEAIAICQVKLPDLILLDALMPEKTNPDMDGFLACQTIKQLAGAQNVPILMVTSLDDEMSVNKAMESGASDYITKPVNYDVLQSRVKQLLKSSHSERQLRRVTYTDTLTGLPNRAFFINKVSTSINNDDSKQLTAILFLGLDEFKTINDALGHETGDVLLQSVAKRLKSLTNDHMLLARTSGDEFCFLLKQVNALEEIDTFVQSIRFEISQPFYIQRETIKVTASVGISVFPTHGKDLSQLMKRADTAMYYAKERQAGYLFFDSDMGEKATRRLKVLSGLHEAIHGDQLVLNYQPQYSVKDKTIIGCEALVRWNSPHHQMIYPDEFIPYAEESGLIRDLGEWVILTACKQLKKWEEQGFNGLKMAINLSGKQLEQKNLPDRVAEILNQTGVKSENIEFEITESSLIDNAEESQRTLNHLRDMGIDIAIDDFGTGFNTMSHFIQYPIDTIKIDKSFTDNIDQPDGIGAEVIKAIVVFSKTLNHKIIAEGVETQTQRHFLEKIGCDYLQGYLLGKPMSAAIFEQSVLRKNKMTEKQKEVSVTSITKHVKKK